MTDSTVQVEAPAYVKLMLHAAKYPWAAVNGFLLGEGSAASKGTVAIKDAVPLFHTSTLTPLLETSATMVGAYAAKLGLSIVGLYQAHQALEDNSPGLLGLKIMERLDTEHTGSVLLVVNNKKLAEVNNAALTGFARDASSSFRRQVEVSVTHQATEALEVAFSKEAESMLTDMDEHLDDVTRDWRNDCVTALCSDI